MAEATKEPAIPAGLMRIENRPAAGFGGGNRRPMNPIPKILVFDSGLGGLTVFAEIAKLRPHADYLYVADDAAFPYGAMSETALVARVLDVIRQLVASYGPDAVVIACNTASTLVLPHLRAAFPNLPFIGTVPAIKPAGEMSRSRLISVLATPGTVARDYTHDLVRSFASHCAVTLVGSQRLAALAEAAMRGESIDDSAIAQEIAPCFIESEGRRTDCVVLACTHFPLLLDRFRTLAPWPVGWIDPAPAIARRVDHIVSEERGFGADREREGGSRRAFFTKGMIPNPVLEQVLRSRGLTPVTEVGFSRDLYQGDSAESRHPAVAGGKFQ